MSEQRDAKPSPPLASDRPTADDDIQPSWKPLLWLLGLLLLLVGLGEVFLEFGLHLFELVLDLLDHLWLVVFEAPEEHLVEDPIEALLKPYYPQDAYRYAEIITAVFLTPVKLGLVYLLLRWAWRHSHKTLLPRIAAWFRRHYRAVQLAWRLLAWPYKLVIGVVAAGCLIILI